MDLWLAHPPNTYECAFFLGPPEQKTLHAAPSAATND